MFITAQRLRIRNSTSQQFLPSYGTFCGNLFAKPFATFAKLFRRIYDWQASARVGKLKFLIYLRSKLATRVSSMDFEKVFVIKQTSASDTGRHIKNEVRN